MYEFIVSFILGGILLLWCIIFRFSEYGKVKGEPLGMPRGTVRALITLMLVAFPFGFLISGGDVPGLVVNVIFIAVAFYFQARKSEHEKLQQIVNELKSSETVTLDIRKEKKPLYLPKYSVRILIIILLMTFLVINWYIFSNAIDFLVVDTIIDLIFIIALYLVGAVFRAITKVRERKRIKKEIADMDASLSEVQIIEKLMLEPSWWKRTGKNVLSIIMLIVVVVALTCYSLNINYLIVTLTADYDVTVVGILLLFINAYYGFRD
jgi:hypothetical protein